MPGQSAHHAPSMALRIETFSHHGSFSRYSPHWKRARSEPNIQSQNTEAGGLGSAKVNVKHRRTKSESAAEREFARPLLNREGVVTFGRQTISLVDIIPPLTNRVHILYPVFDGCLPMVQNEGPGR